jgi:integrase
MLANTPFEKHPKTTEIVSASEDNRKYEFPLDLREYQEFKARLPQWKYVLAAKTLLNTGLRINEMLRLQVRHFNLRGPEYWIEVVRSKKRDLRPEPIWLNPNLGVELRDFIAGGRLSQTARVFSFTDRRLRQVFEQAGIAGIGRPVHPHQLRHLFSKTLIDNQVPIEAAAKLLGHTSSRTTEKWYYDLTRAQRKGIGERMAV